MRLLFLMIKDNVLGRGILLSNIARVYLEVQDFDKADGIFERAFSLSKETDDSYNLFNTIYNRGIIASKRGNSKKARILFADSLTIAKSVNRHDSEAYVSDSFGYLNLEERKNKDAKKYFDNSIEISKSIGLKTVWCASLIGLGKTYLALEKPTEAIKSLRESLDMSSKAGMLSLECECLGTLAQAYEKAGKLKEAVEYFNRLYAHNATVHSQERQRAIVEVQARVEIDKADRERARMELIAKDANERAELLRNENRAAIERTDCTRVAISREKRVPLQFEGRDRTGH